MKISQTQFLSKTLPKQAFTGKPPKTCMPKYFASQLKTEIAQMQKSASNPLITTGTRLSLLEQLDKLKKLLAQQA